MYIACELPLFDPVRFTVIDPMYNFLLGTAKHALSVWVNNSLLTQSDLNLIQQRSEKIKFPYDTGQVPIKIGRSFSGFTADQWRVWTVSLSPIMLKAIIPDNHLRCWLLFVRCCSLLCRRIISVHDIEEAHTYLTQFCKSFEQLRGEVIVPLICTFTNILGVVY